MSNALFIAELLETLPLWVALIMSLYPEFQNEEVFWVSLGIGSGALAFVLWETKRGRYNIEEITQKSVGEALALSLHSILLLILLLVLAHQDRLYMATPLTVYIIASIILEFFIMFNRSGKQKS
ncbi:MAG: hypothetical protein GXO45_06210 [Aquificae bacterium]|nr:hypothetical protein [Aquificota bacterium]